MYMVRSKKVRTVFPLIPSLIGREKGKLFSPFYFSPCICRCVMCTLFLFHWVFFCTVKKFLRKGKFPCKPLESYEEPVFKAKKPRTQKQIIAYFPELVLVKKCSGPCNIGNLKKLSGCYAIKQRNKTVEVTIKFILIYMHQRIFHYLYRWLKSPEILKNGNIDTLMVT